MISIMSGTDCAADVCLALLVGLPGSGKTSLAKFMKHYFLFNREETCDSTLSFNVIHVCYDDLISADLQHHFGEDSVNGKWRDARQEVLIMVEKLISLLMDKQVDTGTFELKINNMGNKHITKDFNVEVMMNKRTLIVIDDNMYYSSMRYLYFQLARRLRVGFCQIYLECSLDMAKSFNIQRSPEGQISNETINRMATKMEPPGNNPWEIYSVQILAHRPFCSKESTQKLKKVVFEAFLNPFKPLDNKPDRGQVSRQNCMASVLHQADLGLRCLVNERMKILIKSTVNPEDLRAASHNLTALRLKILDDLRTGKIVVPEELSAAVQLCQPSAGNNLRDFLSFLLSP